MALLLFLSILAIPLPIGGNPNASLYVFASPGIGVAGVGFGDDIEDQIDER